MDHLLPDKPYRPRNVPWTTRIYRLIGSPNTAGKEELIVVGLLAFMLLAGVVVGTAMLPRDSEHGRMAAMKIKYSIPSSYAMPTTTTTTTTATTRQTTARHHTPRNEEGAAERAEEDNETDDAKEADDAEEAVDADETTIPTVEEQNESDSKKEA